MKAYLTNKFRETYYNQFSGKCILTGISLGVMSDREGEISELDLLTEANSIINDLTKEHEFSGILGESELQISFTPTWNGNITTSTDAQVKGDSPTYDTVLVSYTDYLGETKKIGIVIRLDEGEYIGRGTDIFSIGGFNPQGRIDFLNTYTDTTRIEDSGESSRYYDESDSYYSRLSFYSDRLEYEMTDELPHRSITYINKLGFKIY